jgi:large subunit ribosomal protein L3
MFHRAPGGIGGSSFPSRVWKNQHFPGHMGNANVTAKNLKVVKVDSDENLLLVRGSVPGPSGTYIFIRRAKNAKKVSAPAAAPKRAK